MENKDTQTLEVDGLLVLTEILKVLKHDSCELFLTALQIFDVRVTYKDKFDFKLVARESEVASVGSFDISAFLAELMNSESLEEALQKVKLSSLKTDGKPH